MNIYSVPDVPKLHNTPLATVKIVSPKIIVELDDENENRFRLLFSTYQAVMMTTADCFYIGENLKLIPQHVVFVEDSPWLNDLKSNLSKVDETADFLDDSKHFIIPLQDDFLEIVADSIVVETI